MDQRLDVRNTRSGTMSDALQRVVAAQEQCYGEDWVGGVAHVSLDMADSEELPSGTVMLYDRGAKMSPASLPSTLGQYLMVTELLPRKGGYKDADFQTAEARQLLAENIPQFNEEPPSFSMRHPRTNDDTTAWGPELGQEDGMVGVFKIMEPNGRDARYYLAARSAIPEVVHQFKQDLARTEPEEGYTFGSILDDPRLHYVEYLGRRNGYRILDAAAKALGLAIHNGPDGDAYLPPQQLALEDDASARPYRAEPEYVQSIGSVSSVVQGGKERVAIFHGLAPSMHCNEKCFTYVSPYDGIIAFPMRGNAKGLAMPVTTGRRPQESWTKSMEEASEEIGARAQQSSILWEDQKRMKNHIELHPDRAYQVDRPFLRVMQQCGWNRNDERDHMIPVLLKISNPMLRRPRK